MISVVIPSFNSERQLPRCFVSLVPAAIKGVVREVVVADGGSADGTGMIADHAGAHFVVAGAPKAAQFAAGVHASKHDWLLLLDVEVALEQGWEDEAQSFLDRTSGASVAALFRFALEEFAPRARRKEAAASLRWHLGLPYCGNGLLLPRALYRDIGGLSGSGLDIASATHRLGRRRLHLLRARAILGETG